MWLRFLYPTPKLDVRAVVLREGKLLLVREATDGRWSLPGG
jgi:ADP-ribose pyrophosphatase YjhB (NUDIX family)